jgi:thiol-disulfide isomerase/thioredoxin
MSTTIKSDRRQFLRSAGMAIAASGLGTSRIAAASFFSEGSLPSLGGATGWLNSSPLTKESLRDKVVLIDFWTYTCINWRRTLPYVRAWHEKYAKHGLAVIGVHTCSWMERLLAFLTEPTQMNREMVLSPSRGCIN